MPGDVDMHCGQMKIANKARSQRIPEYQHLINPGPFFFPSAVSTKLTDALNVATHEAALINLFPQARICWAPAIDAFVQYRSIRMGCCQHNGKEKEECKWGSGSIAPCCVNNPHHLNQPL